MLLLCVYIRTEENMCEFLGQIDNPSSQQYANRAVCFVEFRNICMWSNEIESTKSLRQQGDESKTVCFISNLSGPGRENLHQNSIIDITSCNHNL